MKITFLGTGGAFTDFRENYHNNALVVTDEGSNVLIDCGATALQSLKELGYTAQDIDAVLITHIHGDHVAGIEQLLWERFYTDGPAFNKTTLVASRGILDDLRAILTPSVDEITCQDFKTRSGGYDVLVDEVETKAYSIGGVTFNFHPTPHVEFSVGGGGKEAYGVEVIENGCSFYYTSDTTFRSDIGDRFPDASIIFHDCTLSQKYPGTVHTHLEDLLTLEPWVQSKILLMHYGVDRNLPEGCNLRLAYRHDTYEFPLPDCDGRPTKYGVDFEVTKDTDPVLRKVMGRYYMPGTCFVDGCTKRAMPYTHGVSGGPIWLCLDHTPPPQYGYATCPQCSYGLIVLRSSGYESPHADDCSYSVLNPPNLLERVMSWLDYHIYC